MGLGEGKGEGDGRGPKDYFMEISPSLQDMASTLLNIAAAAAWEYC